MGINVFPQPSIEVPNPPVRKTEYITSTQSWVAPSDCHSVDVVLFGGGGGGGGRASEGGAGGGGGAQYLQKTLKVTPSTAYTITIGSGGSGGSTGNGSNGGSSTFGNLAISYGGGAGLGTGLNDVPGQPGSSTSTNYRYPNVANYGGNRETGQTSQGNGGMGAFPTVEGLPGSPINMSTYSAFDEYSKFGKGFISNIQWSRSQDGGAGIDGAYCGGGGGGTGGYRSNGFYAGTRGYGHSGGGHGSFTNSSQTVAATPADANSGSGGGGGSNDLNSRVTNGSNGGSGLCIITYWTSE